MNEKSYETNTVSYDEAFRPVLNVHLWFASTKRHAGSRARLCATHKQKKVEKNTKMKKTKEEKMMKKEEEEEERNETEGPG